MRYIPPIAPPTPPFVIDEGFGNRCIHDANGIVVWDELTEEEAKEKLAELTAT